MRYDLKKPCDECPFLREGGVRLTRERIKEIAGMMLSANGGHFPCHKTTGVAGNCDGKNEQHCAGALIFAEKNGTTTQMMRIAERLGMYDASQLVGKERVFCGINEMLATALPGGWR